MHLADNAAFEGSVPMSTVNLKFNFWPLRRLHPIQVYHNFTCQPDYPGYQSGTPRCPGWLAPRDDAFQGSIPSIPSPQDQLLPGCGVWSQLISWNKQQTHFRVIFAMEHQPLHTFLVFHRAGLHILSPPVHMDWLAVGWETSFVLLSVAHLFPHSDPCVPLWEFDAFSVCGFYCSHNREHWGREENVS